MINWANFKTTAEDYDLISKIADRVLHNTDSYPDKKHTLVMDLECAFNDTDLDLQRLLDAPECDFFHDIYGIRRNLDRETGKVENCFLPRLSKFQGV